MTNIQFYSLISVGAGSIVTVILAWLYSNQRLSRLETTTDAKFANLDLRFSKVEAEMISLRNTVYQALVPLHERVAVVEERTK